MILIVMSVLLMLLGFEFQKPACLSAVKMAQETSLLDLDDYCLRHIFSFLSTTEQIRTVATCRRFMDIIGGLISHQKLDFNLICQWWLRFPIVAQFFERHGHKMKRIHMRFGSHRKIDEFYHLVPKYCPNIEEICYNFIKNENHEIIYLILNASKNLKILSGFYSYDTWKLVDPRTDIISKLSELERLTINTNLCVTGSNLNKLTKLKWLDLEGCSGLESRHFIDICRATKLKRLNIIECDLLDATAFEALLETQSELEGIGINHEYPLANVAELAKLKNLQYVYLKCFDLIPEQTNFFNVLAQHHHLSMQTLKLEYYDLIEQTQESILKLTNLVEILFIEMDIYDDFLYELSITCVKLERVGLPLCKFFTNDGVIDLVTNLQDLSHLDLEGCSELKDTLFHELVEIKSKSEYSRLLTLNVMGTYMNLQFTKSKEVAEAKKWIELLYERHFYYW